MVHALAFLLASLATGAAAEPVRLSFAVAPGKAATEFGGRELLIVFPAALPDGEGERVAARLGPLAEGVTTGRDSIRVRLSAPATARLVKGTSGRPDVEVSPMAAAAPPGDEDWEARRLLVLEARTQARDGDGAGGRARLSEALERRPDDPDLLLALAGIETESGRLRGGLALYERVLGADPGAEDVGRARDALALRLGPSIRTDAFASFSEAGDALAAITVTGEAPLGDELRAEVISEARHGEARALRRSGAATGDAYSAEKARLEAAISMAWGVLGTSRAAVFAAPRTLGGGLQHRLPWSAGVTTTAITYGRPYWDTLSGFAADAVRDQAVVSHAWTGGRAWAFELGGGGVRYGTPAVRAAARGAQTLGSATYTLPTPGFVPEESRLRVGYRFAGEYLDGIARAAVPGGAALPVLDVRTRELHVGEVSLERPLGPGVATLVGGYAHDRYGGGGPVGVVRYASGGERARLVYGAEAGISPSLSSEPQQVVRIGAFLAWRFGR